MGEEALTDAHGGEGGSRLLGQGEMELYRELFLGGVGHMWKKPVLFSRKLEKS